LKDYVVNFPEELKPELVKRDQKISLLWGSGLFQEAEKLFQEEYDLIRKYEEELPKGKRFHKGYYLHNWGVVMILQNEPAKIQEGYQKIIFAFVEDLFDHCTLEQVHELPAYKTLKLNPFINEAFLNLIENKTQKLIKSGTVPRNPEDVLKTVEEPKEIAKTEISFEQIKPTLDSYLNEQGEKPKRVFVGGNYKNIAVLNHLAEIIKNLDFFPVLANNFKLQNISEEEYENLIHDISMEMLKECSYAIFEVTISDGHLMEIERAIEFTDLKVLLVYQTTELGRKPTITRMLMAKKFEKKGYRNFTQLTPIIQDFLKR